MKISLLAYAKINLFLDVTGRRENGYHTITGVMQAVDLSDRVTVTAESPIVQGSGDGTILLTCSDPTLPADAKNLAYRAAVAYFAATGYTCDRLLIDIEKHSPAAAGLAGGSTDAAATLVALNELCGRPLDEDALCAVGLTLGADVPFCIKGGTHLTEGVGEELTPLAPMPDCEILIACAGEGVSTPAAYRALDEMHGDFAPGAYQPCYDRRDAQLDALRAGDLDGVCASTHNIFESAILPERPVAASIKETMQKSGAIVAMMSGSGPSVFGVFRTDDPALATAQKALQERGIPSWRCRPVRKQDGESPFCITLHHR